LPKDDHDVKTLWFQYISKAEDVSMYSVQTTVRSAHCSELVEGIISGNTVIQQTNWLSFGKHLLNEAQEYSVLQNRHTEFTVRNAHHRNSLKQLLPNYEASGKHRKTSYYDQERGEQVAGMPLDSEKAQELLLISTEENNDRFAYHQESGKFYRFKLTHPDKNIYHGFQIKKEEISEELIKNCMM
jgi:hypothetical protein